LDGKYLAVRVLARFVKTAMCNLRMNIQINYNTMFFLTNVFYLNY